MGKRLRQLECWEWVIGFPRPSTDAADTSSFTLSRQRENIAALEVEWHRLLLEINATKDSQTEVCETKAAAVLQIPLQRHATIRADLPRRLSSRAARLGHHA